MLVQRITYVGELGYELYVAPEQAVQVWDRLMAAGSPRPVGYAALDSLRIEKGYRYLGTDLTASDTPYEAGLGFCVALDKPEFNGREALVGAGEPAARLRTLLVGGEDYLTMYGGEAVHAGGEVIGRVRSCAYGFTVRRNVALAKLPAALEHGDRRRGRDLRSARAGGDRRRRALRPGASPRPCITSVDAWTTGPTGRPDECRKEAQA